MGTTDDWSWAPAARSKGSALSGFEASSPAANSSSVATLWAASRDTEVENGGRDRCLKVWASQFIGDEREDSWPN